MHKILIYILVNLTLNSALHAQNGNIKGILIDAANQQPLQMATVSVFTASDTALVTYRLSDPSGHFQVPRLKLHTPYRVLVTFEGYQVFRRDFSLTAENVQLNLDTIALARDHKSLDEVLVVAERPPVTIRNDTLEFRASAFQTLPNALLEDLLKKLPGVDIDNNGNLTVRGRKVNRLLVDGRAFFNSDYRIATRNLPANVIDKVQVVDDGEEVDRSFGLSGSDVGQIINIKLKKAIRQGWFGKAYAGKGSRDHYEAGGIINTFRDTLQLSLIGFSNNINKIGFSMADLRKMGGFSRSGVNNINTSEGSLSLNGVSFGGGDKGILQSTGVGTNINHELGKKVSVNFQYFYGQLRNNYKQEINSRQFFADTILVRQASQTQQSHAGSHSFSGALSWKIDPLTTLTYRPGFSLSTSKGKDSGETQVYNNFEGLLTQLQQRRFINDQPFSHSHNLFINKKFNKKAKSLIVSTTFTSQQNKTDYVSEGTYTQYRLNVPTDSLINQLKAGRFSHEESNTELIFHQPIGKLHLLSLNQSLKLVDEKNNSNFFTQEASSNKYTEFIPAFSNGWRLKGWTTYSAVTFSTKIKSLEIIPGINLFQLYRRNTFFNSPTVTFNSRLIYPSLTANWNGVSLQYRQISEAPFVGDLQQWVDISNPLYRQYGNPDLQPSNTHQIALNTFKYFAKSNSSIGINISGSLSQNLSIKAITWDAKGVSESRPIAVDGIKNLTAYSNFNKQYKLSGDWQLSLRPTINSSYSNSFVSINGKLSRAKYLRLRSYMNTGLSYQNKVDLNLFYSLDVQYSFYDRQDFFINTKVLTHFLESEVQVRWSRRWALENKMVYSYNHRISQGISKRALLWNAAMNFYFLKEEQGQLRLYCYDILNQGISVSRTTTESMILETESTLLKRYFMLSFVYNIRNFRGERRDGRVRTLGLF